MLNSYEWDIINQNCIWDFSSLFWAHETWMATLPLLSHTAMHRLLHSPSLVTVPLYCPNGRQFCQQSGLYKGTVEESKPCLASLCWPAIQHGRLCSLSKSRPHHVLVTPPEAQAAMLIWWLAYEDISWGIPGAEHDWIEPSCLTLLG